jgi:hypothetical protein
VTLLLCLASCAAQVKLLLLAPSSAEVGPKGSGPREASLDDLLDAALVLIKSRELLDTLSGKLAASAAPVRPVLNYCVCCRHEHGWTDAMCLTADMQMWRCFFGWFSPQAFASLLCNPCPAVLSPRDQE